MMRIKRSIFYGILLAMASVLCLGSCQDDMIKSKAGDEIRFTAGSGYADTKAVYSGSSSSGYERIDWQTGDQLRIYCAQASEPAQMYADYKVTSVDSPASGSVISTAHIEISDPEATGLSWGTGSHTFHAVYPSPETGGIATAINANVITASLPATQNPVGEIAKTGSNWTATPDLKNMLMTAKTTSAAATMPEDEVFLNFTALTTAIQFTIKNDTGAELDLTSVQLISGNGKTSAEPVINGAFSVDLDQTGIASGSVVTPYTGLDITYNRAYPLCSRTTATSTNLADRTVTINVGTASEPLALAVDETFTFTFFLNPIHHFDDLTFKFTKADGSWMSTRLGYTDGDGIFFPRHKKSFVTGLLVPEGAQWTVKYAPNVVSWDAGDEAPVNPLPKISERPVVTSWDSGVEQNLDMRKKLMAFIDLGLPSGTKWADMNIGATNETEYGDHYAWGELETKATYTLATYRWPSFEKYNGIDNLYTLKSEDDVANQLLGGRRHIPTREQFEELFNSNYTTFGWVNNYDGSGVNGYLVTSKLNGNFIFLPAAGLTNGTEGKTLVGTNGCYWSSSLNPTPGSGTQYPSCAIDMDFSSSGSPYIYVINDDSCRQIGESIRPVENPNIEPFLWVDLELPSNILWANMNIGSDIESDMGSYYAWGELTTKNSYTEENYSYNDNVSVLPAAHDIATQTYGTDSHIPSLANFTELFDTNNTTIDKSNPGYWVITSKRNGKSITLPVSGYYSGSSWHVNYSPYWINEAVGFGARIYDLANDCNNGLQRYYGTVVRAVKEQ